MTINFKGFENWVEIFRGGAQIDSKGKQHDGDAIIDKAVSSFDPTFHEPPAVIGHPKDNAPGYAWVKEIKAVPDVKGTKTLFAKFDQVVPEFADAVSQGMYKKRSASFYDDGRLRHVGFLGAQPPAVKGLKNIAFADDGDGVTFEFSDPSPWTWGAIGGMFRAIREWIIEKDGKEKADSVIPEWNLDDIADEKSRAEQSTSKGEDDMEFSEFLEAFKFWKKAQGKDVDLGQPAVPAVKPVDDGKSFSEADIEAAKKQGAADAKKALAGEARQKEIRDFCEGLAKDGKIPPSWIKGGMVEFMQQLDAETDLDFAEGEKKNSLAYFKEFLEGLGKFEIFQELVTKEKAAGADDGADFAETADLTKYV